MKGHQIHPFLRETMVEEMRWNWCFATKC